MFIWTICECSADCFHKKRDIFLFITFAFLGWEADVWPIMEVNGALTVSSQNSIYLLRIDWSGSQFSFVLDLISSLYLWSSRVHLWNATRNPFTHDNGLILKQFRNVMTWLRWVLSACLLHSAVCSVHSACHIVLHSDMFTVLHTAVTCLSHSVVCSAVLVWCAAVLCCCAVHPDWGTKEQRLVPPSSRILYPPIAFNAINTLPTDKQQLSKGSNLIRFTAHFLFVKRLSEIFLFHSLKSE